MNWEAVGGGERRGAGEGYVPGGHWTLERAVRDHFVLREGAPRGSFPAGESHALREWLQAFPARFPADLERPGLLKQRAADCQAWVVAMMRHLSAEGVPFEEIPGRPLLELLKHSLRGEDRAKALAREAALRERLGPGREGEIFGSLLNAAMDRHINQFEKKMIMDVRRYWQARQAIGGAHGDSCPDGCLCRLIPPPGADLQ